jgi:hypothetical protein
MLSPVPPNPPEISLSSFFPNYSIYDRRFPFKINDLRVEALRFSQVFSDYFP